MHTYGNNKDPINIKSIYSPHFTSIFFILYRRQTSSRRAKRSEKSKDINETLFILTLTKCDVQCEFIIFLIEFERAHERVVGDEDMMAMVHRENTSSFSYFIIIVMKIIILEYQTSVRYIFPYIFHIKL